MTIIVKVTVLLAALLFIGISATMNALFLSSFGRDGTEIRLLAGVSIAADAVKAVLPVVLVRAVLLRAWGQALLTGVMLAVVIAMSLASGLGFAARMRSEALAVAEQRSAALRAREAALAEVEQRLITVEAARPLSAIVADLDAAKLERAWAVTKSCTQISGPTVRHFCERMVRLRGEHAAATERESYYAERKTLRDAVTHLRQAGGNSDADPQTNALAELLGVDRRTPRMLLTTSLAVVLELGSIVLILLAAGPALRGWREPGREPKLPQVPVAVPASVDRRHWERQRAIHGQPALRETSHVS